jgi:hypothetical protein
LIQKQERLKDVSNVCIIFTSLMVVILFVVKLTLLDFMVMFGADNVFLGIADLASFPN